MRTILYDPSAPVPALTRDNERALLKRRATLPHVRRPRTRDDRVAQFELYLIEAIFAAAVRDSLQTARDGWTVVHRRTDAVRFHPDSGEYRQRQNEFAEALNNLNTYLSR